MACEFWYFLGSLEHYLNINPQVDAIQTGVNQTAMVEPLTICRQIYNRYSIYLLQIFFLLLEINIIGN